MSRGFHIKDDWYFKRLDDSHFQITHVLVDPVEITLVVDIDSLASAFASISKTGDTVEKWKEAKRFLES
jgi:hypothetical protein